jgi:hypothetical protein
MGGCEWDLAEPPRNAAEVQHLGDEITDMLRAAVRANHAEFATALAWSKMGG